MSRYRRLARSLVRSMTEAERAPILSKDHILTGKDGNPALSPSSAGESFVDTNKQNGVDFYVLVQSEVPHASQPLLW